MNGKGFDVSSWAELATFNGRCATAHDVDGGAAVFALGETLNGRTMPMTLPQPVIWWDEHEEEKGAVAVQAEAHETEDGELMEVLGLVLPDGSTAVALHEDVDEVDAADPVWAALVAEDAGAFDDDDDEDGLLDPGMDSLGDGLDEV
jgi:hypothetical protein